MQKSSQVYITQHSFVHCKNFKEHGEIRQRNVNISFHWVYIFQPVKPFPIHQMLENTLKNKFSTFDPDNIWKQQCLQVNGNIKKH